MLVQGPTVMPEYWRNPEATSEAFHEDGWLRTGDAGFLDDEGMLSIVDRIKEVIIVGSCNVYPADVESVLADCPQIAESAVVGRPDDELGEVPVAFVVLREAGDDERRRRQGPLRGTARRRTSTRTTWSSPNACRAARSARCRPTSCAGRSSALAVDAGARTPETPAEGDLMAGRTTTTTLGTQFVDALAARDRAAARAAAPAGRFPRADAEPLLGGVVCSGFRSPGGDP